jgi:hypothetical protein
MGNEIKTKGNIPRQIPKFLIDDVVLVDEKDSVYIVLDRTWNIISSNIRFWTYTLRDLRNTDALKLVRKEKELVLKKRPVDNLYEVEQKQANLHKQSPGYILPGKCTIDVPFDNKGVDHPKHYNSHPTGIECIDIVRHYNFNIGNVIKYVWRAGLKDGENNLKDLEKALWYLQDEIKCTKTKK